MELKVIGNIKNYSPGASSSVNGEKKLRVIGNIKTGVAKQNPRLEEVRKKIDATKKVISSFKYAIEMRKQAEQAGSTLGMAKNFAKALPQTTADVLLGTPLKLGATAYELKDTLRGEQASQKEYKVPGFSPFKSFQSDIENAGVDYYSGKSGKGKLAWEVAKLPLAALETYGIGKGIGKGAQAFSGASSVSQGIRKAAPEVLDAFVPTTRGLKSGATEAKLRQELGGYKAKLAEKDAYKVARQNFQQEKQATRNSLSFFDDEMDGQYSQFKNLYNRFAKGANKEAFESMDINSIKTALAGKVAPNEIDNIFYSQNKRDDEMLDSFLTMMEKEKNYKGMKFNEVAPNIEKGTSQVVLRLEKQLSSPGVLAVQDLPQGTPNQTRFPKFLTSGEKVLQNQGSTGKVLLNLMENQRVAGDLQTGKWKALVNKFTGQLNDEQKMNLTDVLEGKARPMDSTVGTSAKVMRNLLEKIQGEAVGAGLNTGKLENYFPRKYNWSEMIKSGRKEEIYQHMVDTGQASTKAEAEQFFKDFVIKNSERKAGNLEYERMFDVPGYERDPEKALSMYAETAAKRITETKAFGKGDETISALINKISDEGGDYKSAQKIFDYVYKGEDKNAFANALLGYNVFTKLSLSFFSNLTQSANTAAKGGLLNTIKGAGQALAQGYRATKGKSYDDIAMLSNAIDEHISLQESGLSNKFIKGAMYFFQKVENFNRRTAANTGVLFAKELSKNPKSAYAVRQLESLGIKVEDIFKGKLTNEQLLTAANKMAKTTQFKMNALMMPQEWRTPLGKILTQFKGFSFMQTKFLRDEVIKEVGKGNLAPLLRFLAIAPVASYVTQSARNYINQSKTQADFRKLDLYRKAVGDLPSDIVSQMQYANEKKDKFYTTPLINVKNYASPVIGPTGGEIMQLMSALEQKGNISKQNEQWYSKHPAAQKDPNLDLKRFVVQKIPFIGRNLSNTVFGYKPTTANDAKAMAKEALETGNKDLLNQAIEKDPYLNNARVIQDITGKKVKDMSLSEIKLYNEIKSKTKKPIKPYYKP